MATTMGQIIKNLRKGRGFTQEELAERLGVTYQAISKWENDSGMPDISQIVPLATIFDVSTDFLFGIDNTSETEEALKIVSSAGSIQEYGKLDTYLKAYDILLDGLKKYPNNYMITYNCMNLGFSLSLSDNPSLCDTVYPSCRKIDSTFQDDASSSPYSVSFLPLDFPLTI